MKTYSNYFQFLLFGVLAITGLIWIYSSRTESLSTVNIRAPQVGFLAPEIDLETLGGSYFSTDEALGKPIIINFWASWCPPCRAEMPDFQQASEEYDSSEILIVGINATNQDAVQSASEFVQDYGLSFPIALDTLGRAASSYQVHSLPTTFFIDANGIIQKVIIGGPLPLSLLRIEANQLLEGSS